MKSKWALVRNYINSKEVGYIFTRKELISSISEVQATTIDCERRLLVVTKFIEHIGRGKYQLVKKIPEGMTTTEILLLIQGDTLQYLEKVSARKERQKKVLDK